MRLESGRVVTGREGVKEMSTDNIGSHPTFICPCLACWCEVIGPSAKFAFIYSHAAPFTISITYASFIHAFIVLLVLYTYTIYEQ